MKKKMSNVAASAIFDFDNGAVRTVVISDDVWFVGKDVAESLGYKNTNDAIGKHCLDVKSLDKIIGFEGVAKHDPLLKALNIGLDGKKIKMITQYDIIRLVMKSRLPSARKFEKWIIEEVIPSILSTGRYESKTNQLPKPIETALNAVAPKGVDADEIVKAIDDDNKRIRKAKIIDIEFEEIQNSIRRAEKDYKDKPTKNHRILLDILYSQKKEWLIENNKDISNFKVEFEERELTSYEKELLAEIKKLKDKVRYRDNKIEKRDNTIQDLINGCNEKVEILKDKIDKLKDKIISMI